MARKTTQDASRRIEDAAGDTAAMPRPTIPSSLPIAREGIHTGGQFARLMSALMTDLIEGAISPEIGNATCNAGGKLLKVVELQYKYGIQQPNGRTRILELTE